MPLPNFLQPPQNKYYEKAREEAQTQLNPYSQAGRNAISPLQDQFAQLLSDPSALFAKLASGYQQSPGYQFQQQQGQGAAMNAAAAGGMAGSPMHQQNAANISENIANQDFYNYMSKALGLYGTGLQGMEDIFKTGESAGKDITKYNTDILENQAKYSIEGNPKLKLLMSLIGAGAGAAFGGPAGAQMGAGIGKGVGGLF